MNNVKMLLFDRINVLEGDNVNKTSKSNECDYCHSLCFSKKGFKLQP